MKRVPQANSISGIYAKQQALREFVDALASGGIGDAYSRIKRGRDILDGLTLDAYYELGRWKQSCDAEHNRRRLQQIKRKKLRALKRVTQ